MNIEVMDKPVLIAWCAGCGVYVSGAEYAGKPCLMDCADFDKSRRYRRRRAYICEVCELQPSWFISEREEYLEHMQAHLEDLADE